MPDIVNHSSFSTQVLRRKKNSIRERERESVTREPCFSDITIPANQTKDIRLKSDSFRRAVRTVFEYMGIENTMSNFKKYDHQLAWLEFANNIQNPTKTARVNVLWYGEPSTAIITVELPGRTEAEAIKSLDTEIYKFVEWSW